MYIIQGATVLIIDIFLHKKNAKNELILKSNKNNSKQEQ